MANKSQLVKSASNGYNYSYTSLTDIALQGHKIPKMRLTVIDGVDYVQYWDKDTQEWQTGARVVVPDMKGSNAAQNYGAALSYSRRYATLMGLALISTDDEPIELDITNIEEVLAQADSIEQLNDIYSTIPQRFQASVKKAFTKRKTELELLAKSDKIKQAILNKEA